MILGAPPAAPHVPQGRDPEPRPGVRHAHQASHRRVAAGHDRAGDVPRRRPAALAVADPRRGGRRRARRRRGQRVQLLHRPRHRPADAAHVTAAARRRTRSRRATSLFFGVVLTVVSLAHRWARFHQLARHRADRGRDRLLRPRLHHVAQAHDAAEHRLGRRLRGHAGADRLGRGHRRPRRPGVAAVRGRLPVAAAALLRAGDQVQGRLRPRRHPDAAGRRVHPPGRRSRPSSTAG